MLLSKEDVEAVFEKATSQEEYLVGIYKLVLPAWDSIETIEHWPSCNEETWKLIARMAMAWDEKNAEHVLAGGAWMNHGFSSDNTIRRTWQVNISSCKIKYKPEVAVGV